ncbi:pimeloyl-ACP methyl ester carboxylesterase [Nocardiopsis sp. Huas11]|uniref:alpha/beta fold hydrolase n=1 Tax=Nocardiopsis sp. Huas11 TaxID=2183912 RepID=UPI000EB09DBB|nr:alpha/beta fold hydrolase [Nocardiopsis sp. Huas11]RKS08822.1 pimeloyl-ACP methyl ester carboxylesterase [Nocardiopsis sp. Huas11]
MSVEAVPGGVDLDEGHIAFHTMGERGSPVVLLHGGGMDHGLLSWRHLGPDLARDHRVFLPDLPKHGGSWPWAARADQAGQVSVLERLLDHWGLESATLVGLSMGGAVATGFALAHPARVDRLVMIDSGGIQDRVAAHGLAYVLVKAPLSRLTALALTPALVRRGLRDRTFQGPVADLDDLAAAAHAELRAKRERHAYSDWQRHEIGPRAMRTDLRPRLGRITCPALVVHGAQDDIVPLRFAREAAERMPRARLVVVEGAGHWSPVERPGEVGSAVRAFLRETSPA